MSLIPDDSEDEFGQPEGLIERVAQAKLLDRYERQKDKAHLQGFEPEVNFFRPPEGIALIAVEDMWLPRWQRGLDAQHAIKLALRWTADCYNVATLCTLAGDDGEGNKLPEGKLFLNDAQQRTAAALCREAELIQAGFFIERHGVKRLAMPGVIHSLESARQAMDQFISINVSQKKLSKVQIYMAEVNAGKPAAIGLYRKLHKIGIHIVANPIGKGDTNAIYLIKQAIDQNEDWLLMGLASLREATEFPIPALLLEAIYNFICNRKGKVSPDSLTDVVVTLLDGDKGDPKIWLKKLNADLSGVHRAKLERVVSAIVAVYNMNNRKAA